MKEVPSALRDFLTEEILNFTGEIVTIDEQSQLEWSRLNLLVNKKLQPELTMFQILIYELCGCKVFQRTSHRLEESDIISALSALRPPSKGRQITHDSLRRDDIATDWPTQISCFNNRSWDIDEQATDTHRLIVALTHSGLVGSYQIEVRSRSQPVPLHERRFGIGGTADDI